ncbi:MAG: hypothetical protein JWO77_2504 [Ilumatobacteraceae bacterium]|nr:hypothetical protein [Ilumatobacteraceae bacterium]
MGLFGRRAAPAGQRRSGPEGEAPWWDDADQAFVEAPLFPSGYLGRGWQTVPMWNNAERVDPYGDDDHSAVLRAERARRTLTALDEGAAWRRRADRVLVVPRVEVFADPDDRDHRAAWKEHATACLDAVWRLRWRERDTEPGWIEARWKDPDVIGAVASADDEGGGALGQIDWITVEDQTGTATSGIVERYQHLTVWCGRGLATITLRHDDALDLDDVALHAAFGAYRRLWQLDR